MSILALLPREIGDRGYDERFECVILLAMREISSVTV